MANIELVERLLRERYNVASLDGLGPLSGAVQAARAGDIDALTRALDGRELYRWRAPIDAAMAEADDKPAAVVAPPLVATAATSDDEDDAFPELGGTVDEIKEWIASIDDADTLREIAEAEEAGKDRVGVRNAIEAALEQE